MTTLEGRYRRLLGVYPPDHRRAYEQEMLGVLMAGSKPEQRFPALGEALDLMRAGFLARIGQGSRGLRTNAWRDACAVAGLLTALALLAVSGRRLYFGMQGFLLNADEMRAFEVNGLLLFDVVLRSAAWLAVVVAILAGLRRTAAGLSVAGILAESAGFAFWLPRDEWRAFHLAWVPVLVLLCAGALFASIRGRSALRVLGRRGVALVVAGLVVGFLGAVTVQWGWVGFLNIGIGLFAGMAQPVAVLAGALVLAGIWCAGGPIRRRVLVLLAPTVAVPVAQATAWDLLNLPVYATVSAPLIVALAVVVFGVPLVTFAAGLLVLERREEVAR